MKAWLFTFLILVPLVPSAQSVVPVDRIVAVVNKEVITATELADAVGAAERQLRRQKTPLPERVIPVGYADPDKELRVVDPDGNEVPQGEVGELMIRSP